MAQCVQVSGGQVVVDSTPVSSCSGYLLLSADEVAMLHALPPLSIADAAVISAGIAGVWATAWVFRQIAGFLWVSARSSEEVL
ncbi:hypothetical protein R77560_01992 [Ralstonia thomasii]|uniref:Uncharacterized protein n=2 Tax=Ralstonia TaxID=48736 RepID=A0AAD2F0G6_9RALS|nr:hypothetical protein R77560_01992 [Ralstonia sp. LMG 18095]